MGRNNAQFTAVLQIIAAVSQGKGTSLDALRVVNEGRGEKSKTFKELVLLLVNTSRALKSLKYHSISGTFKFSDFFFFFKAALMG